LRDIEDDVGGVNASFSDLDRERKTMMRSWAKCEEQFRRVVEPTASQAVSSA
jgi:hypothetical protein